MDKIEYKRFRYEHNGQTVYEWEQSLEELHCYIVPPAGVKARQLDVAISARHLTVGIKGNPPFLSVRAASSSARRLRSCMSTARPHARPPGSRVPRVAHLSAQEDFAELVNSHESFWTLEDGVLHLTLCKGSRGVTWPCLVRGHESFDPLTQQEVQRSLMLERFQAEHPGFDFSGASFSGQVPDPKTFMEGVRYT